MGNLFCRTTYYAKIKKLKTASRSQKTMEGTWKEVVEQSTELAVQGNFNEKIKRE
jgi:hypothetical protein